MFYDRYRCKLGVQLSIGGKPWSQDGRHINPNPPIMPEAEKKSKHGRTNPNSSLLSKGHSASPGSPWGRHVLGNSRGNLASQESSGAVLVSEEGLFLEEFLHSSQEAWI